MVRSVGRRTPEVLSQRFGKMNKNRICFSLQVAACFIQLVLGTALYIRLALPVSLASDISEQATCDLADHERIAFMEVGEPRLEEACRFVLESLSKKIGFCVLVLAMLQGIAAGLFFSSTNLQTTTNGVSNQPDAPRPL